MTARRGIPNTENRPIRWTCDRVSESEACSIVLGAIPIRLLAPVSQ
jgi:hypothetical protein